MLAENSTFISDFAGLNSGSGADFAEPTGKNSKNRGHLQDQKEVCLRMFTLATEVATHFKNNCAGLSIEDYGVENPRQKRI